MRNLNQYIAELSRCESIIEALRYTSLLHCDQAINDATYIQLVSMLIHDNHAYWLADPVSIRELSQLICQRNGDRNA